MVQLFNIFRTSSPTVQQAVSNSWEERDKILEADTNLFCWKREKPKSIEDYLNAISIETLEPIRKTISLADLESQIEEIRSVWESNSSLSCQDFWEDIQSLSRDFLTLSNSDQATLHLKFIHDNGCTKFHTDRYKLRLFTTYFGEGTEWVPENAVNRDALGSTNEKIVKDATQIQRLGTYDVGILKGEIPGSAYNAKGIVHKSPAIGKDDYRIILRVDI